jgi:hypothetical protein
MSQPYKPRRQSSRWLDGDCPRGVLAIYDNRGRTADRYTVFYADPVTGTTYQDMVLGYRNMSENPFHPQGVGMYGELRAHLVASYRYTLRHQACRWTALPERVRECVLQDLKETNA